MAIRIRHMVAHFPAPFRLESADGLHPDGPYAVDVHDGWQAGSFGSANACMTVVMYLPTAMAGRWVLRAVPLTPREIAMVILADRELTGVHRNVD
jgi:hypothetical protein